MSLKSQPHTEHSQDFELNLAPIIDCFTVLITFMLISASFLAVGILDAGAGVVSQPVQGETPPPIAVEVQLQPGNKISIKLSGKSTQNYEIPARNGSWDFEKVQAQLSDIKSKWPTTDSIMLSAMDEIEYQNIILAMENIRKIIPGIALGGF